MMENNRSMIIFADVQQENPEYLCMDTSGDLYLCTVGQQNGGFVERIIKKMTGVEAQIFVANACNKARRIISESRITEGDRQQE